MKAYKAYEVDGDCATIVFAESAGAAKRIAQTTDACVFGPCDNETPSHGDKIRRMSDEELASVLVRYEGTVKRTTVYGGHEHIFHGPNGEKCGTREYAVQLWTDWLRKPEKED